MRHGLVDLKLHNSAIFGMVDSKIYFTYVSESATWFDILAASRKYSLSPMAMNNGGHLGNSPAVRTGDAYNYTGYCKLSLPAGEEERRCT